MLDTCVLVPSRARDVLLEVASMGAYRPLWSKEILAELDRTLRVVLTKRGVSPEETDAYLTRLFRQMETTFPDALVTDWESLIDAIQLPDPDDRHVVAAARAGAADVIVTDDLSDFPPAALPAPLARQSLDDFLLDSLDLYPRLVTGAVHSIARRTGRSGTAMTVTRDVIAAVIVRRATALASLDRARPRRSVCMSLGTGTPGAASRLLYDGDEAYGILAA
jgi:predicted nucleic acid-binding protein